MTDGPLRVGVQAALWIVTIAAVTLAVAGFAMSATVAVRTRRLELARLQALGAARSGLVRSVLVEHAILGILGLLAGLTLGAVLGRVVAPLVTVSASGSRPVPERARPVAVAHAAGAGHHPGRPGRAGRRADDQRAPAQGVRRAPAAGGRTMSTTTLRTRTTTGWRATTGDAVLVARRRSVQDAGLLTLAAVVLAVTVLIALAVPRVALRMADDGVQQSIRDAGSSADVVANLPGGPGFGGRDATGRPIREADAADPGLQRRRGHGRGPAARGARDHGTPGHRDQRTAPDHAGRHRRRQGRDPGHPPRARRRRHVHRPASALGRGRRARALRRPRPAPRRGRRGVAGPGRESRPTPPSGSASRSGRSLQLTGPTRGIAVAVVSGLYEPVDATSPVWADQPDLLDLVPSPAAAASPAAWPCWRPTSRCRT